jgi:hypothetical protein
MVPTRRHVQPPGQGRHAILGLHHGKGASLIEPAAQDSRESRVDVLHEERDGGSR